MLSQINTIGVDSFSVRSCKSDFKKFLVNIQSYKFHVANNFIID